MSLMNCAILAVWPSFVPYTIRYFDMFDRFCRLELRKRVFICRFEGCVRIMYLLRDIEYRVLFRIRLLYLLAYHGSLLRHQFVHAIISA